jgi:hypothetical protein
MSHAPTISVAAKVVGQKKLVFKDWRIPLPLIQMPLVASTLRDLISNMEGRCSKNGGTMQTGANFLHCPNPIRRSAWQNQHGWERFRVKVSEDEAISMALQAFEHGLYYVFIDNVQYEDLNQTVFLAEDSHIMFVRLIALAGG